MNEMRARNKTYTDTKQKELLRTKQNTKQSRVGEEIIEEKVIYPGRMASQNDRKIRERPVPKHERLWPKGN